MPYYSGIYVISEKRDRNTIESFLNEFLPDREESASEYEFPQYSDAPEITYREAAEVIGKCINDRGTDYRLYWRTLGRAKPEFASELLQKLKLFLRSNYGYIGHEASTNADKLSDFMRHISEY